MLQSPIPEFRKGKRRISSDKHGRVCGRKSERWHCQGFNESRKSNGSKRTGVRKTISPFVHSAKQQTESQQDEQAEHTESIHRNAPNPHRPNTLTTDDHSICRGTLATAFEKRSSKSLTHESCVGCLHSQRTSPFVHPRSPHVSE